jgi:hypothetical protein
MPSASGASEAAKQINVIWKYPASKLQRLPADKTKGGTRSSPRSSNRAGASPRS